LNFTNRYGKLNKELFFKAFCTAELEGYLEGVILKVEGAMQLE
jgi:hypothetical protein